MDCLNLHLKLKQPSPFGRNVLEAVPLLLDVWKNTTKTTYLLLKSFMYTSDRGLSRIQIHPCFLMEPENDVLIVVIQNSNGIEVTTLQSENMQLVDVAYVEQWVGRELISCLENNEKFL